MDFTLLTEYHWFDSHKKFTSTGGIGNIGKELDMSLAYTFQGLIGKVEWAHFTEGNQFSTTTRYRDTDKLWTTVMYTF
jgi:hypothetical protein